LCGTPWVPYARVGPKRTVRTARISPAQVPTCCCLRTIHIEQFEQMEGGGGELTATPLGKVQQQCNFDTTCCLSTKYRAMFVPCSERRRPALRSLA